MRRVDRDAAARGLVGPEAQLLPGPGPAVRLQLAHPDDLRRLVVLDMVWDRAPGAGVGLDPGVDYLLFRGWADDTGTPLKGRLSTVDGRSILVENASWSAERWRYLEQRPAAPNELSPPAGAPYLAVWVPAPLSAAVQEWLSALEYRTVPSPVAQSLRALMHGFFGVGGLPAVQRGLAQLAAVLAGGGPPLQ